MPLRMTRRLCASAGVALVLAVWSGTASAQQGDGAEPQIEVQKGRGNRTIVHTIQDETPGSAAKAQQPGAGVSTGPRARVYYAEFPELQTLPDGTRCLRTRRVPYDNPTSAAAAEDTQNILWRITTADFPICPRTPAPAATPAARAAEYWRVAGEDLLPKPQPRIAPGFMLAGKLGYLEAGTTPAARFEHDTPLGVLTIEATSRLYVDWGDDTPVAGPFDTAGGPWPNGTITHSWTDADRYDVVVTQRWAGRWQLGGESGTLAGLETQGLIDDFEVRQLQAVRNL